jgi:hypothetical protein
MGADFCLYLISIDIGAIMQCQLGICIRVQGWPDGKIVIRISFSMK